VYEEFGVCLCDALEKATRADLMSRKALELPHRPGQKRLVDVSDSTRLGIRDRAMLHLCFAGGLRVSELVGLSLAQVSLHRAPSIRVHGKGRKERSLPLWKETATDLRAWLAVREPVRVPELFGPN